MSSTQRRAVRVERSLYPAGLAILLVVAAMLACKLTPSWTKKNEPGVLRCFAQGNSTPNGEAASRPQSENLVTSEDGGFTIKLPNGFPPPDPPGPIKRGHEYAGISYYSYKKDLSGCRCRVNYTELTAIASSGKSEDEILAGRRELVSKELVNDRYQPVTIYKSEESRVQNHRELSVYVSGTGVNGQPEYRRSKFIVGRGLIYTIEFAAADKTELDHPEVNAFFNSFQFVGDLDGQAISKPEAEYPAIGRAMRAKGTVVVEVTVDTDGQVIDARAVTGPVVLQASAIAAARKARFAPGKLETKGTLTYNFTIP